MIDQHSLTGESTPAEKGCRRSRLRIHLDGRRQNTWCRWNLSGGDTTSAEIAKILNDSAGYKLLSQIAESDWPTRRSFPPWPSLGRRSPPSGPAGAVAVLNSDFGTGIRMAAPLAMLTSLTLCATRESWSRMAGPWS